MNEQEEKIYEIVVKTLRNDGKVKGEITPESRLREDLGLDSLDYLAVVTGLEENVKRAYRIKNFEISDSVALEIKTVKDIVDYILKNVIKK